MTAIVKRYFSATGRQCFFEIDKTNSKIGFVTLNRPEVKNALSRQLLNELKTSIAECRTSKISVVIVRSIVDKAFCSGADLKERLQMSPEQVDIFVQDLRSTFRSLEALTMPTIAALDGIALGGGLELALSCDLRYAGSLAKLGLPESKLAIIPGAGGTQKLPRLIGISKAKELMFRGQILDSQTAATIGLVNGFSEDGFKTAFEVADEISQNGPIALRMIKQAVDQGIQVGVDVGLSIERLCYAQVIPTKDRTEALKAFSEKRKPNFIGE